MKLVKHLGEHPTVLLEPRMESPPLLITLTWVCAGLAAVSAVLHAWKPE